MQLEVTLEEAVYAINLIGKQPIESGAGDLYKKLRAQVEQAQQPQEAQTSDENRG